MEPPSYEPGSDGALGLELWWVLDVAHNIGALVQYLPILFWGFLAIIIV